MNRNKWKILSDQKHSDALGMLQQTARKKLDRQIILHFARKCGLGNCFQCGFPIENTLEMSIEHIKPWGGDGKDKIPDPNLFWDLDNIALSHKWCNVSMSRSGIGLYKYTGVHGTFDKRRKNAKQLARACMCFDGKPTTLGEYHTPEEAAIAYDLSLMYFRQGRGKLNFESLRNEYTGYVQENVKDESFFKVRNRQLKKAVEFLCEQLSEKSNKTLPQTSLKENGTVTAM